MSPELWLAPFGPHFSFAKMHACFVFFFYFNFCCRMFECKLYEICINKTDSEERLLVYFIGHTQRRLTILKLVSVTFVIIYSPLIRYCRLTRVIVARLVSPRSDSEHRVVRNNSPMCVLTVRAGGPL